jgi:hypothetical protein
VVQNFTATTAIETGRTAEAVRIARAIPTNGFNSGTFAWILSMADSLDLAREVMRTIESRGSTAWRDHLNRSMAALALGDTSRALDALEAGLERREPIASWVPLWVRLYDPVRSTARFRALLRRIGLDEATLNAARRSAP